MGPRGCFGPTGPRGTSTYKKTLSYILNDTNIDYDNGSSRLYFNINACDFSDVTEISVNAVDATNISKTLVFQTVSSGSLLYLTSVNSELIHIYTIISITDNSLISSRTDWTITVTNLDNTSETAFNGEVYTLWFVGGGGGSNADCCEWIDIYLKNPPPPLIYSTIMATSTEIYIPWLYPKQTPYGHGWLPDVNAITSGINVQTANISTTLFSKVSTNFIDFHNNISNVCLGAVLSKLPGTNGLYNTPFPQYGNKNVWAWWYHDTKLANIVLSPTNTIWGYYSNTNPETLKSIAILSTFVSAGPPSTAINLLTQNITESSFDFSYITTIPDITDPNTKLTIKSYTLAYFSNPSVYRYTTLNDPPISTPLTTLTTPNTILQLSNLYPDSQYKLSVFATNTANLSCPQAVSTYVSTLYLNPPPNVLLLNYPDRYYTNGTIRSVETGIQKTRVVNSNTPWTSYQLNPRIHNISGRGSVSSNIMNLSTFLSTISTVIGPAISFGGFGKSIPPSTIRNNLNLSPVTINDMYSQPGYTGFYLQSRDVLTINTPVFQPSKYDYIISVSQSGSFIDTSNFMFQYDTPITTPPVINSLDLSFKVAPPYIPVTGVNVLYGQPVFTISTVVSNMGSYYYSSPLLNYINSITGNPSPSASTDLTNITPQPILGKLESTLTIVNTLTSQSLNNLYLSSLTMSITANNIFIRSGTLTTAPIPCIVDGPSWNLVTNILAQTIQIIATNTTGCRYKSGVANTNSTVPNFLLNTTTDIYDNRIDLTTNEDLQISNGFFITPMTLQSKFGYIDYRNFFYDKTTKNLVNYTSITPSTVYRYATFVWQVQPRVANYLNLSFKILNCQNMTIYNTLLTCTDSAKTPIRIFYRTVDMSSPIPTGLPNMSSAWINGNNYGGIPVASGSFQNPTDYTIVPTLSGLADIAQNGSSFILNESIQPLTVPNGSSIYLILRIGLPLNKDVSFQSVTGTMS
jgi:hypothetical protein